MKLTQDLADLTPAPEGAVVSIGVFDGVHRGHRAILDANVEEAQALGAEPTVVTFQTHPKELLLGRGPRTLTSLEHRLALFARAGIRHTVALPFDDDLRNLQWERFVEQICVRGLDARRFVLGFDSKFGRDREGNPELLSSAGYDVRVARKVEVAGRAISSTAIREAVELGDLPAAMRMLGRPVTVFGTVVEGQQLGRTLGFPTANLDLHHELQPPPGVYACRVRIADEDEAALRPAVANIGVRPTVTGEVPTTPRLEVHLFDWSGDLYGQRLEVQFLQRLRSEQRFDGVDALRAQIARDCDAARAALANSAAVG